jgi:hypothetical protein
MIMLEDINNIKPEIDTTIHPELDTARRIRNNLPDREAVMGTVATIDSLREIVQDLEKDREYHIGLVAVARNTLRDREDQLNGTKSMIEMTTNDREGEIDGLIDEMQSASDDDFIGSMIEALKQRGCDNDHPNMIELYLLHIGAKVIERRALEEFKAIMTLDTSEPIPSGLKLLKRQIELLSFMKVGDKKTAPGIGQPYLLLDTTSVDNIHISSGLTKSFMLIGSKISLDKLTTIHDAKTSDVGDENLYKSIALFSSNDTELGSDQEFTLTSDEICISNADVEALYNNLLLDSPNSANIVAGQANIQHLLNGLEELYHEAESNQQKEYIDSIITKIALNLQKAGYKIVLDQDLSDGGSIPKGQFVLPVNSPNSHVERVLNREIKKCADYMYKELVETDNYIVLQTEDGTKVLNRVVPTATSGKLYKKSRGKIFNPTTIIQLLEESLDTRLESGFYDAYLAQPSTNTDYRNIAFSLLKSKLTSVIRNPELEDRRMDKAALKQIEQAIALIDQATGLSSNTNLDVIASELADQMQAKMKDASIPRDEN